MDRRHIKIFPGAASRTLKRARQRSRGTRSPARLVALAALMSLALACLLAAPTGQPAHAAPARPHLLSCNGPCIGITNPLYPSQGQLVAEGPVGTILTVEGVNWPPSTGVTIWPAPDAATCAAQLTQPPSYARQPFANSAGILHDTYVWPQAVNKVNQVYILCAVDGTTTVPPNVQSNGINMFTVLSAEAPSVTVTPTSIIQGQDATLTVSGQNWLPQQPIAVSICSDANRCTATAIDSQTSASDQYGNFQTTLTIKAGIEPGTYFVQAVSANQALQAPPANAPLRLTVSAPTPTPTATPSPTPTPTPTPTPANNGKGGTTLLIVLLGTFSLLFLIGGIVSIAIYIRGSA